MRGAFQRETGYCVFGSALNSSLLTAGQRMAIERVMTLRSDFNRLSAALNSCRCGVQLLRAHKWYDQYAEDQSLLRCLDWILSGQASGEIVANVEETDGSREHYLLLNCDEMLVLDTSPKYGPNAHPLNAATMEMMRIRRIIRARKIVNRVPRVMRASRGRESKI